MGILIEMQFLQKTNFLLILIINIFVLKNIKSLFPCRNFGTKKSCNAQFNKNNPQNSNCKWDTKTKSCIENKTLTADIKKKKKLIKTEAEENIKDKLELALKKKSENEAKKLDQEENSLKKSMQNLTKSELETQNKLKEEEKKLKEIKTKAIKLADKFGMEGATKQAIEDSVAQ